MPILSPEEAFKRVIAHAKEYGFIFQSSELYGGLSAVYDYGQNGVMLKNNLRTYWWKSMVQVQDNVVGLDSAIFMHPTVWRASGHIDAFNDPLIDNKDSKKRYRADVLVEEYSEKIRQKAEKEVAKARERFGATFDEALYRSTNPRVVEYLAKADETLSRFNRALEAGDLAEARQVIVDEKITCPVSGSANWTELRQFNLMFSTKMGSVAEDSSELYLRPETAQGIFVNFLNIQKTGRMKLPFGIAQTGKAFRNEIVARQFIFRMREFEQMEMQYFVRPGSEMQWYEHWKSARMRWHLALGLGSERYRFHDHDKLAHYANAASDIEFDFPFGFKELEGIHSRTDFDLSRHEEFSGRKVQYFDPETNESYTPYVVETSLGLDRLFLAVLATSLDEETLEDGTVRTVLRLPYEVAPTQVAILPLIKKDGLPECAQQVYQELRWDFQATLDEKDAIGKRYRRQDAVGTPYCVTIDHQTLVDKTVTLRDRDSMKQVRCAIGELANRLHASVSMTALIKKSI
jgi:glycyl-tRNA synthetase